MGLELKEGEKTVKTKEFSANFTYNNIDNKFNLSQYQKNIENNLTNKIIDDSLEKNIARHEIDNPTETKNE